MKVTHAIIAALAVVLLVLGVLYVNARGDLADERAAYADLVLDTKANTMIAEASWKLKVKQKEDEYVDKANVSDQRYAALHGEYRAAVLRAKAAARGGTNRPAAIASSAGAGVPQAEAAAAELCISDDDAMTVSDLAAYATAAHEWALTLEPSGNN